LLNKINWYLQTLKMVTFAKIDKKNVHNHF
jgi:hypothetical protein